MRISREQMLIEMAYIASKRGTCGRLAVGAIIAREARVISLGYVGAPTGAEHCEEHGCDLTQPCTRTLHAERNSIDFAKWHGINVIGADLFVTDSPCTDCATMIINSGIRQVFFDREYRMSAGIELLLAGGVQVHRILANGMHRQIGSTGATCAT